MVIQPSDNNCVIVYSALFSLLIKFRQISSGVNTFVMMASFRHFVSFSSKTLPHLHLTTSKVMVIVWGLRGNIIGTVLYIANVLPL